VAAPAVKIGTQPARRADYLPFASPTIGDEEIAEVVDTLRSNWISTGPKTKQFESDFAAYLQVPGALAMSSCTAALHTALVAAGIKPGDEVITTPMTFAASVNVIEHIGARPILADVEPDTLNIDPKAVEAAITPRTRAILPVHYAGHPADLDALWAIADARRCILVEDAAHALSARYRGQSIGAGPRANPVAFSFYATKNMTTAEGGMLTGSPEFLAHARIVGLHGMSRDAWKRYDKSGSWFYEILLPGFKYNMTDIQAALGMWQLRKLARFQERRAAIIAQYNAAFVDEPALELPVARPEVDHAWHIYVLRLRLEALRIDRARFIQELAARNIGTSVHFIPIHLHPFYRDRYDFSPLSFPVAFTNYERMLSLPLGPRLSDRDVGDVIEAVLDLVRRFAA
jgi:dTDP-4-amino-4,6-dideoxygalactose transaminase